MTFYNTKTLDTNHFPSSYYIFNNQFTCEEKSNNKISFLHLSITRMNSKLVMPLYRKKTFSGVYMNYNSFLPLKYKKSLIDTLLFRAFNICADYNTFHNEVQYLS